MAKMRVVQGDEADRVAGNGDPHPGATATEEARLAAVRLDGVGPRPVRWLVPGFLPLGKIAVLAGAGGLGKSSVTLNIAAGLSRGCCCCGLSYVEPHKGSTLLVSCEDDPEDTLVPRLLAHGADREKVYQADGIRVKEHRHPFTLADVGPLSAWLAEHPDCRLVVIDPATAFVGAAGVDDHKDSELRALLGPLAEMAGARSVAVVLILHTNKATTQQAVNRVLGGVGYVNASRAAFLVAADRDDPSRRLILPLKNNLSPDRHGLIYRTVPLDPYDARKIVERFPELDQDEQSALAGQLFTIRWEGRTEVSADDALAPPEKARELSEAAVWLRDFLGGRARLARECHEAGDLAGVSLQQRKRARRELNVSAEKEPGIPNAPWYWMPPGVLPPWQSREEVGPSTPSTPPAPSTSSTSSTSSRRVEEVEEVEEGQEVEEFEGSCGPTSSPPGPEDPFD